MIPSPLPDMLWIVSVCQGEYIYKFKKKKKTERKKKKNTDGTQANPNAPYVWYDVKTLP